MAFSSHRTRFKGELAGIKTDQLSQLDYTKNTLKERKEYINNKYEKVKGFYNDYIFCKEKNVDLNKDEELYTKEELEQYYKYNLNASDNLSQDINVFKTCERDATYLLNSSDIQRDKKQQYIFLNEEEFLEKIKKEKNISCEGNVEVLEMLVPATTNTYINMDYKIDNSDFNHHKTAEVLGEYSKLRDKLRTEMDKIKSKDKDALPLYLVKNNLQTVNDDMILSKIQLRGIRDSAKKLGDESGAFDIDSIDYSNPKHIKSIVENIKFGDLSPSSDLSHIAYDIEKAIKTLHSNKIIDDIDMEIVDCVNNGYTQRAIAEELGLSKTTIVQRMNKIYRRISEFFS